MAEEPVHYEVFIRCGVRTGWSLDLACELRSVAIETAEEALTQKRAIGVKVLKETLRATGDYDSVVILARGDLEPPRRAGRGGDGPPAPLCLSAHDLYTVHGRARIGRLFEGWLRRQRVTAFELLHRPDLVEQLDAAGLEIQHAIQKVAVPEAQATGASTHEVIRRFQQLADRAVARLLGDARRGVFPELARDGLGATLQRAAAGEAPAYLLGVAVARHLADAGEWTDKIERLLDLADACPEQPERALLFHVLEQPLCEILGGRAVLAEMLSGASDLGRDLSLLMRLAAPRQVEALAVHDPELARGIPEIGEELARLARWLQAPGFAGVRAALGRRVLDELNGPRRLHPDDPAAEIRTLRALARLLILCPQAAAAQDVEAAFVARSRRLLSPGFVHDYLEGTVGGPLGEMAALVRLAENVVGGANKLLAGDWLHALAGAHRFERDLRAGSEGPAYKLAQLAELQHAITRVGLEPDRQQALAERLGELADRVETDTRLIQAVVRASSGAVGRLLILLRMANGDCAPVGPVSRRAGAEALKLARDPLHRAELSAPSEGAARVRQLLRGAGLAA